MNISRQQLDKLVVGTNDVSYVPPDTSPTGTAVLNGPVYVGDTAASPGYEAVLNVASNSAAQNPLDTQPRCCLLYTSPSPRDNRVSRMPSSA